MVNASAAKGTPVGLISGRSLIPEWQALEARSPGILMCGVRFMRHVRKDPGTGCWEWQGCLNSEGYGKYGFGGRYLSAHRFAYLRFVGPLPAGKHLDHLCHGRDPTCNLGPKCPHRRCVNPDHLEPVTPAENSRRSRVGFAKRAMKACKHGHPFDEANTAWRTDGTRRCRACGRDQARRHAARSRLPPPPPHP